MNDTAATPKLAVIATRLPYIDRRSLSEAWFSALHLVADAPAAARQRAPRMPNASLARPPMARTLLQQPAHGVSAPATPRSASGSVKSHALAPDAAVERVRDAPVCARVPRAYQVARSYPPFRTSLAVGVDGTRVQLLLRRDGATLYVVALCRPEDAALVSRALAAADAHLRIRGESVRSSVRPEPVARVAGDVDVRA